MPANTAPIFTLTPKVTSARVSVANTASDGSGTLGTLFTAGANGSRIERLRYANSQATAAASSNMVIRWFLTDTGGINPMLLLEIALAAATRSVSAVGASGSYTFSGGLIIASGQILKVCQSVYAGVQDQMDYWAEGADY